MTYGDDKTTATPQEYGQLLVDNLVAAPLEYWSTVALITIASVIGIVAVSIYRGVKK